MRTLLKLVLVALAALVLSKLLRNSTSTARSVVLPLDVRMISGDPVQSGKPTILEFWATWCGPCRQTIPHLNRIDAEYRSKGLQIIGLTTEDSATVLPFQKQVPMRYTVVQDYTRNYHQMFKIRGIPSMILLDAGGNVVWQGHPAAFRPEEHLTALLR